MVVIFMVAAVGGWAFIMGSVNQDAPMRSGGLLLLGLCLAAEALRSFAAGG